jgi:hypothetical protein
MNKIAQWCKEEYATWEPAEKVVMAACGMIAIILVIAFTTGWMK